MANCIEFTVEALSAMTPEQKQSVVGLVQSEAVLGITVQKGGFDLPAGYLAFRVDYRTGTSSMYGGIDPEGRVST